METMLDPVTVEVLRNSLPAAANEMAYDLQRTSYNMMIYEVRDFSCAIVDAEGRLLAQNVGGVSHFVSDLDVIVKDAIARFGADHFRPGDAYLMNHQRVCGQHLNNMVAYTPIFFEGELFGFSMVRAHWVDIGGMSTGFGASGGVVTDPWIEGLQFDQVRIMDQGRLDDGLMRFIADNVRYPDASMGDLRAQLAACAAGSRRVEELIARYGLDDVLLSLDRIFADSEARCRRVVEKMPDGEYRAEGWLDHDFVKRDERVMIVASVVIDGSDMVIDLTESARERRSGINSRTRAGAYIAYKGLTAPLDPLNEGSFRSLRVELDEGNFMMARFPSPMAEWSIAIPTVVDVVLHALAPALPDHIPAANYGSLGGVLVFFGADPGRGNKRFVSQTIEGGGWGARPFEDGQCASVSVCQGDVRNAPIESLELKHPLLVERRSLRVDSGGAGRFRGGLGQITEIKNLVEGTWIVSTLPRETCPPWGIAGGLPGASNSVEVREGPEGPWTSSGESRRQVPAGSAMRVLTGGGGGWGAPGDRPFEALAADLREGLATPEAIEHDYRVVLDDTGARVDEQATKRMRVASGDAPIAST